MKMRDRVSRALVFVGIAAFALIYLLRPVYSQDVLKNQLISDSVQRGIGSFIFLAATVFLGYRIWGSFAKGWWLAFLPACLIAVNNFPIVGLLTDAVTVTRWDLMWIYGLDCLMIGLFEEVAFRGTIFPSLLEKRRGSTKQIFWVSLISSALFGLLHLVNLLDGAGVGATLLQVGYSFLIGGMCTIVLLRVGNVLPCVFLHTLFDFGGRMVGTVADGVIWDPLTVVVTAVLGVAVTVWMLMLLWRVKPQDSDHFFVNQSR